MPLRQVPLSELCLVCGVPLGGRLGSLLRWAGISRSSRNPNCCNRCNAHLEEGRLIEMTLLFADLSSFTEMTNRLGAEPTYDLVDRYLRFASSVLTSHGAFIDKYVGDAVMAFFNMPVKRPDHAKAAVEAARELQAKLPELSSSLGVELRATVGIATGHARVGRLGSDDIKDYSAIGEVVNLAARLQAQAKAGEIVVSDRVYAAVAADFPGVPPESLTLKGFRDKNVAYRLLSGSGAPPSPEPETLLGRKSVSLGGLLLAVLGAGCLGLPIAGVVSLSLGLGSASALVAAAKWLDRGPLHTPLLLAAAAGALLALGTLVKENRDRNDCIAKGACITVSPREKRHNLTVAALSLFSLLFVGAELYLHHVIRRVW